jgi:hypothetical protein
MIRDIIQSLVFGQLLFMSLFTNSRTVLSIFVFKYVTTVLSFLVLADLLVRLGVFN